MSDYVSLLEELEVLTRRLDAEIEVVEGKRAALEVEARRLRQIRRALNPNGTKPQAKPREKTPRRLTPKMWLAADWIVGSAPELFTAMHIRQRLGISDPTIYEALQRMRAAGVVGKAHVETVAGRKRQVWRVLDAAALDSLRGDDGS